MNDRNKLPIVIAFVFGLLGLGWFGYSQLGQQTPAQISIEPTEYDFGAVSTKTDISFVMRNLGSQPLEILGISTSCGCTSAWSDQEAIMPGGSAKLHVSFDPTAHEEIEGEVFRQVYVRTNDPEQPEFKVDLRATLGAQEESQS